MKKFLILCTFLCAFFTSALASAKEGTYVGADVLWSNAKHKYSNLLYGDNDSLNGAKVDSDDLGFGLNLGYKTNLTFGSFEKGFVAPEIFYDYLNNSSKDFAYTSGSIYRQDSASINSRYGAKLNVGYEILPKLSGFVNFGVANVDYDTRWPSSGRSYGASKIAPIYGVGLSYNLTDNWAMRASYDYQRFNTKYVNEGLRDKVTLGVLKVGAAYSF